MKKLINNDIIAEYMKKNSLSKRSFSKLCKISVGTLNKVFMGSNLNLVLVFKIAKVMNVKLCTLIVNE